MSAAREVREVSRPVIPRRLGKSACGPGVERSDLPIRTSLGTVRIINSETINFRMKTREIIYREEAESGENGSLSSKKGKELNCKYSKNPYF